LTARVALSAPNLGPPPAAARPPAGGWLVFAVSFGLLLSDYMSRQVLAAVFPQLKAEWLLSDAKLGALGGAVALMVGLLTLPLSLAADRFGRARSVAAMAFLWSAATLACALCANYGQLLAARLVLGVGEAAYGSVGLAVVFGYFPRRRRATITSAFMAGGLVGSFAGLALGGAVAASFGWRGAFFVMAAIGMVLAVVYLLIVREARPGAADSPALRLQPRQVAAGLFGSPRILLTYAASGVQLLIMGALTAWTPAYLNRVLGLAPAVAAAAAGVLLLAAGIGMVACGVLSDRLSAVARSRLPLLGAAFALVTFAAFEAALGSPPGGVQIACALVGLVCAAGTTGPAGAIVAEGAPRALHGASLAVLTLANNLLGLAPGPALTGALADRIGLTAALQVIVFAALLSAALFGLSARVPQQQTRSAA
jgi:predicted MFS family arabinose efflux permease